MKWTKQKPHPHKQNANRNTKIYGIHINSLTQNATNTANKQKEKGRKGMQTNSGGKTKTDEIRTKNGLQQISRPHNIYDTPTGTIDEHIEHKDHEQY